MPAAGDPVFASDVLRARPKQFWDSASAGVGASLTNSPMPGISIVFTTETAGADLSLTWTMDADPGAATTALHSSKTQIVGSGTAAAYGTVGAPVFATYEAEVTTDRATATQTWGSQLGPAGTYTITLLVNTPANGGINLYTTVAALLQEQFA
jgi:hypothetical protein